MEISSRNSGRLSEELAVLMPHTCWGDMELDEGASQRHGRYGDLHRGDARRPRILPSSGMRHRCGSFRNCSFKRRECRAQNSSAIEGNSFICSFIHLARYGPRCCGPISNSKNKKFHWRPVVSTYCCDDVRSLFAPLVPAKSATFRRGDRDCGNSPTLAGTDTTPTSPDAMASIYRGQRSWLRAPATIECRCETQQVSPPVVNGSPMNEYQQHPPAMSAGPR